MRQGLALEGQQAAGAVVRQLSLPFGCYVPVSLALLAIGPAMQLSLASVVLLAGSGLFAWTLGEYLIHRFWLHRLPRLGRGLEFVRRHRLHHKDPVRHPGFLFLWLSSSASAAIWALLALPLGPARASSILAGVLTGYLCYEFVHLSNHQGAPPRTPWGRYLRTHHHAHHWTNSRANYSVVFPVWDMVFRTRCSGPRTRKGRAAR